MSSLRERWPPQGLQQSSFHRYLTGIPLEHFRQPTSAVFLVIGRVFISTIDIPRTLTVDRIIYGVGGASNGNVRLAIYGPIVPVLGAPPDLPDGSDLVVESASVAQAAANVNQVVTIANTLLNRGLYAIGIQGDDVTGTITRIFDSATNFPRHFNIGAYAAFPDPCPVTIAQASSPRFILRVVP